MPRLTKLELQHRLLRGERITWRDASDNSRFLELSGAKERRLFEFLLASSVRKPTGLPEEFVNGLSNAFRAKTDPAQPSTVGSPTDHEEAEQWRLHSIETEGFGGLNTWRGTPFRLDLDNQSLILEGPNGSGKSSLAAAIVWGLTGERPRDQANSLAHESQPVFSRENTEIGTWPPIAAYPVSSTGLTSQPRVHVELTLEGSSGSLATVTRTLEESEVLECWNPKIRIPPILIEVGLLMPSRLAQLRLKGDQQRLTAAVQQLTGFDDMVAVGGLVEGLCHQSREYLSYKKAELASSNREFSEAVERAREILSRVDIPVEEFIPAHTRDSDTPLARFARGLNDRIQEIEQLVSRDIAEALVPLDSQGSNRVRAAIAQATTDLEAGLEGLPYWTTLNSIGDALDGSVIDGLTKAIDGAYEASQKAVDLLAATKSDSRYQLKAVGAKWHQEHRSGPVENCPLCDQTLLGKESLVHELESLRAAGDDAARTFDDSVNAILSSLDGATPNDLKSVGYERLRLNPRDKLVEDLRTRFVLDPNYAKCLVQFAAIVEAALCDVPSGDAPADRKSGPYAEDVLKPVTDRIAILERLLVLARWFQTNSGDWTRWWKKLAGQVEDQHIESERPARESMHESGRESLAAHLSRLGKALSLAQPFRDAVTSMRKAWRAGTNADKIQLEIDHRKDIANSLADLKKLRRLCDSLAREAIEGLSNRIKQILGELHLEGNLRFQEARLGRRDSLTVLGELSGDVRIDATQIANTSWVRAFLWAFLFALREEAVSQIGRDQLPVLVVDDPQMTFDAHHRMMWSQYVKALQEPPSNVQLILATHDEGFLDLIKVDGVTGREALIGAPSSASACAQILEGGKLEREWTSANSHPTQKAGQHYIADVREFAEGMLKQLLRGEDAGIARLSVGQLRNRISNNHDAGRAPWNQPPLAKLVKALDQGRPEVKYLDGAHHTTGRSYSWGEAEQVEKYWRLTLHPALERAYRTVREHRLVHRGLSALYGGPAVANLPEGKGDQLRAIPLEVIGRASALTDGRVADGMVQMDRLEPNGSQPVVLRNHSAYRLATNTLEPVARPGEIVLVDNQKDPTPRSLVVAISEDKILARRYEVAVNHRDVAVLTSQSINPRNIEPPVIAHRSSFEMYKIVGVLYDRAYSLPSGADKEVIDCGGEAEIKRIVQDSLGLVHVDGQSAEPYALPDQYLIVAHPINPTSGALDSCDGHPVIAADSDGNHYFKRLRRVADGVVLESLDSGGVYPPVVLLPSNCGSPCLGRIWPVLGVLFEYAT